MGREKRFQGGYRINRTATSSRGPAVWTLYRGVQPAPLKTNWVTGTFGMLRIRFSSSMSGESRG
jgi:hypothetical protein